MNTRLNLTGRNSNDIYTLTYPNNLLYFMKYDFNIFMERCVDLCKLYMKTGEYKQEEAAEIRNGISGCHKYFEQNLRGAFEKIVIDCWIEYICRQNEIGVITLWNNYIPCKTDFEKAVFMRLSEYRHGHAINQWVNILKVQEYANIKTDFIFDGKLKSPAEAAARNNYFDLMFNVVANELGYDLNSTADSKVFTPGRTPNSPFIMSSVSREIVRNLLTDLRYGDDKGKNKKVKNEIMADQTSMDAFSSMKAFLPLKGDNIVETMIKSLAESPSRVYMPASLKAAIDLEIDVMIEDGAYLQRCELCKDYYLRSEEYDFDYCDKLSKSGRSCREVMLKKAGKDARQISSASPITARSAESLDTALLNERCDRLYKEMLGRINIEFTQRDFSDWCKYMNTMRDNVQSGLASMRDFENFAEYSRTMSFLPSSSEGRRRGEVKTRETEKDSRGREVKPFVFERLSRKDIIKTENKAENYDADEDEEVPVVPVSPRVSTKVIRGVSPESYSAGVVIPHGENAASFSHGVQNNFQSFQNEEEIKIYGGKGGKGKETPKIEEYVKVFNPKKAPKPSAGNQIPVPARFNTNSNARLNAQEKNRAAFSEPPAPSSLPSPSKTRVSAFDVLDKQQAANPSFITKERPEPPEKIDERFSEKLPEKNSEKLPEKPRIPAFITPPQSQQSRQSQHSQHSQQSAFANTAPALSVPKPAERPERPPAQIYASQKTEETQEIGFTDILRGFERKDGFVSDGENGDSDGVPVSHKTKRVMDAIFKPSKPSLFININKGDD